MQRIIIHDCNVCYEKELLHYQAFHKNKYNIVVHYITVPVEWFSFILLLSKAHIGLVWIITLFTVAIISLLQSNAKFVTCIIHIFLTILSTYIKNLLTYSDVYRICFMLQVICWFIQVFIGHYCFECNSPAMTRQLTWLSVVVSLLLALDT